MFKSLTKDTYHELLTCSWTQFFGMLITSFVVLNILFSMIFMFYEGSFVTPSHLQGYPRFVSGLFLSVQTMSTIGYGGMLPTSLAGETIAAFESLIGLMFTALSTGVIFARLSQPSAKIIFADSFLYTETDEGLALVFRVANARGNDIINAQATLNFIDLSQKTSKLKMLRVKELPLRRRSTPTFYLNWMIVHDLDDQSPLREYTLEMLTAPTIIYILNITGHDSSFSQMIFQYQRYSGDNIKANMYFKDMIQTHPLTGETQILFEHLSELEGPEDILEVESRLDRAEESR
jgi:inward rectifier potassium channel